MDGLHLGLDRAIESHQNRIAGSRHASARARWIGHLPFLLLVILPTLVCGIYFAAFATPQYVSQAEFVVRGQGAASSGPLSSLLQTAGGSSASEDTYAVQDYIMSRDAATNMVDTIGLKNIFNRPDVDRFSRFPGVFGWSSFESFHSFYAKHVIAELDSTTGISTLSVRTFRAQDSQALARALLVSAESLVNRMNERQRENTLRNSLREVSDDQVNLRDIGQKIAVYRNREAMLDPMKQSVPMLKDISELQTMLTNTTVQIAQLLASAPNSPLLAVYQRRVAALRNQIALSSTNITGSDKSLVPKITEYDDLLLRQEVAEKELTSAITALDAAKLQANRQVLYLDEITQPNAPDYAAYPKGLVKTAVVFASLLGLFLMIRLIISGAREHNLV